MPEVARAARKLLVTMGLWISALAAVGCGGGSDPGSMEDGVSSGVTTPSGGAASSTYGVDGSCASPSTGCPCAEEGAVVACQGPHIRTGNYISCAPGERMCSNGAWGACVANSVVQDANEVTQDYPAGCPSGKTVRWGALSLEGLTPGDSQIDVVVQAAASQEGLDDAQAITLGSFAGATETSWSSVAVQPLLDRAGVSDDAWLRVTLKLVQASHGGTLPTIAGWQEASTCVSGG